jgi:hypothetical protein
MKILPLVAVVFASAVPRIATPRPARGARAPAGHTLCHGAVGNLAIAAHAADRLGRDD